MKLKLQVSTIYFLIVSIFSQAQTGFIKGKIITSTGSPAEYVNVGLTGTSIATVTNALGEYELKEINPGAYNLYASKVGMHTHSTQVLVHPDQTTMVVDIILHESSQELNEVLILSQRGNNEKAVSIGKIPIKPIDLPQSVASIDKEVLEQQQVLRVSDAIKNFNGVYLMGTSGGYQEELAGRGFAFGSSNTFKNGVRYNNSTMPEMSSLEKIEVLKGSAAILFGNVAAGGVLNLITKKPLFRQGTEIAMRVGSYNLYKPSIDVYGTLNQNKTVAYRLNTSYENAGSFRDQVTSNRVYFNPSLVYKLGTKTEILLEGDYMKDNRTADFGIGAINYSIVDMPRNTFLGVNWAYFRSEQKSTTLTISHQLNKSWNLKQVSAYQSFSSDLFANLRPNGNNQFIKENGNWIRGIQRNKVEESYYIAQLDLTGSFNTGILKHTLLVGADADQYQTLVSAFNTLNKYDSINVFDLNKYLQRNDIPDLTYKSRTRNPVRRAGIYMQNLVSFSEKLKLLAGLRFSYLETFSNEYLYSNEKITNTSRYDHAITPRLGIVYKPIKTTSLFFSYSNSFTPNSGVDINGKALPPSVIDQYEAGIKNDIFHGLLSVNLTAYQIKNSNLAQISLENGNTNSNIKELAGEITSNGVELDIMSIEWKGISVIAGYSYNHTRYTKSNTYIEGSLLRYNPNHTANTSIYYSIAGNNINWLNGFNAGAGLLYIGERMAGRSTRLTVKNDTYKLIPLPAYINLEASLGYTYNKMSIKVKASNLTNTLSYNVHDDNSVNPIAPRMFSVSLTHKF